MDNVGFPVLRVQLPAKSPVTDTPPRPHPASVSHRRYGLLTCTTMHFTWPWFRKQTLAGAPSPLLSSSSPLHPPVSTPLQISRLMPLLAPFPRNRRHGLAGKGFIVSSFTIFGVSAGALVKR